MSPDHLCTALQESSSGQDPGFENTGEVHSADGLFLNSMLDRSVLFFLLLFHDLLGREIKSEVRDRCRIEGSSLKSLN